MQIYHVETQEGYDALMVELEERGCLWLSAEKPTALEDRWIKYKDRFCVFVDEKIISYSSKNFYEEYYPEIPIQKYKAKQNDVVNRTGGFTMRIDDENKVVWCDEIIFDWYKSYAEEVNKINRMIHHVARIGFGKGLTDNRGQKLPLKNWVKIDKQGLVKAILDNYTFKLEQPKKYYWRKKKEYLAWFEDVEENYLNVYFSEVYLEVRAESDDCEFTEHEARNLLQDDFDKFEKVECA